MPMQSLQCYRGVRHNIPSIFSVCAEKYSVWAEHFHVWAPEFFHRCYPTSLHWLPVEQRINYKLAVLTFKTQQTSSPQYLSQHISLRTSASNTRSSSVPLLCVPFRRTSFARRSFSTDATLTWNSLPPAVLNCDSLSTFKSRLKTHLFSTAFC